MKLVNTGPGWWKVFVEGRHIGNVSQVKRKGITFFSGRLYDDLFYVSGSPFTSKEAAAQGILEEFAKKTS